MCSVPRKNSTRASFKQRYIQLNGTREKKERVGYPLNFSAVVPPVTVARTSTCGLTNAGESESKLMRIASFSPPFFTVRSTPIASGSAIVHAWRTWPRTAFTPVALSGPPTPERTSKTVS